MARALPLAVPQTYAALRLAVESALVEGQRRVDEAKLRTYWETGWYIKEHLLLNEDRAEYGAKVMQDLARDLKADRRTLYECLKFARLFPIVSGRSQLSWAYYRKFIQVADPAQRKMLMTETIKRGWTSDIVAERVAQLNAAADATAAGRSNDHGASAEKIEPPRLLVPRRGTPGLHLIVERPGGLGIDLGFKTYADFPPSLFDSAPGGPGKRLAKGDIVRREKAGARKIADATKADLFTYRATIRKVIDGDTLDIAIVLAPGFTRDLKLRLRGLDCPEISTAAGRAAKAFVDALLRPGDEVIVSTTKPDKYDRYLADVFLVESRAKSLASEDRPSRSPLSTPSSDLGASPTFLNNALLAAGHAIRYDGGAKEE